MLVCRESCNAEEAMKYVNPEEASLATTETQKKFKRQSLALALSFEYIFETADRYLFQNLDNMIGAQLSSWLLF